MKNSILDKSAATETENVADDLIETFLGQSASAPSKKSKDDLDFSSSETYKLPVQIGRSGQSLSKGDKPWIVGHFSPGVATDKNHPRGHNGVDLKAAFGIPVYPIASGIVKEVGIGNISGNYVSCLHENGKVQSFYGHLESVKVGKGQMVTQSTIIGTVGDTGNAKGRGAHLHYEVKVNGTLVNPLGISGKSVGSLSKRAELLTDIEKTANQFELLCLTIEGEEKEG